MYGEHFVRIFPRERLAGLKVSQKSLSCHKELVYKYFLTRRKVNFAFISVILAAYAQQKTFWSRQSQSNVKFFLRIQKF